MEKVTKVKKGLEGRAQRSSLFSPIKNIRLTKILPSLASLSGFTVLIIILGFLITLSIKSTEFVKSQGLSIIFKSTWDPLKEKYGGLPFIGTTILVSSLAIIISFPFSLSASIFLAEWKERNIINDLFNTATDLLSAVPSVIYGFWALFVLSPLMRYVQIKLGYPPYGVGVFTAAIVLSIMIIPFWVSISREVIKLVSLELKEAGYSLGATEFEVARHITFPLAKSGILAGLILALGRALGETMAVTMVIGNFNAFPKNIFSPSNTIASLIANQFNEAWGGHQSALIFLGLILFIITLFVNLAGSIILRRAKYGR